MKRKVPKFRKNRKRKWDNTWGEVEFFDPYEMNDFIYKMIVDFIRLRGLNNKEGIKHFVNRLIPGKPLLYDTFILYHKRFKKIQLIEKKQLLVDKLNEEMDNMEEHKNFGLSIIKKKRKKGEKEQHEYQREFDFLDSKIEEIQNMIYLGVSPKRICEFYFNQYPKMFALTPIIFAYWAEETKHIEKIKFAYKASAEEHMNLSRDFMLEWLNKEKHPELDMQHVGIVREIALWHSRMAEFHDRKRYGKKIEITNETAQTKVISGKDLNAFLEGLGRVAEKINAEEREAESGGEEDLDEENFIDFEETE